MKVLTYIKDLPVKLTNENKDIINLEGATLYLDEEGNRYAYVCFNNYYRKPYFALILDLTQYDVGGHLIKKEKYYVPNCFGERGKSVLEKPIIIDKECEAMEINIALALFSNRIFANDELRRKDSVRFEFPRLGHNEPLMPRGNASNFNWPEEEKPVEVKEDTPAEEEVKEEKVYKEVENPDFDIEDTKNAPDIKLEGKLEDEEVEKEKAVVEEIPVEETPIEEPLVVEDDGARFAYPLPRKKDIFMRVIVPIVIGLISVGIFLGVYFIVKGQVPPEPFRIN